MKANWFRALTVAILITVAIVPIVGAAPPVNSDPQFGSDVDNASHPLGDQQYASRLEGLNAKINGKVAANGIYFDSGEGITLDGHDVVWPLYRDRYIELEREGEDSIWTVLGEFGTQIHPNYGDVAGPLHNEIPEPDRSVDNTTIWTSDFSQPYFDTLLFNEQKGANSMRNYYIEQSSGRYTVNGAVEDWVTVPYNEARYGADYCNSIVCATTWLFVRDSVGAWYNQQIADGKTPAEIDAYLSQFDVWDRYDYDGDADFNEPDGYIDHFQSVHAGEGQETGGGAQGTNAIWSHRWYAFYNNAGITGPSFNLLGGVQVGGSSYWIGDYTIEPENGGVGVFAHEFAHDLGIPDLYDTSGNTGGAENSTGFWTLMSSGSYGSSGKPADGIGTKPIQMSAYEKLFLGWSNYAVVNYDETAFLRMGPAEFNSADAQALLVVLPDKQVDAFLGDPYAGSFYYFSGSGNDLDNSMTRDVTLPAGAVTLTAKVSYDIELDWDYAYLTVNGANVPTNLSTATDPNGQNLGEGITGASGGWVDLTADLSAYAGQTVTIGFRYWTDGAVANPGFSVDEISITGQPVDGAESDAGWTFSGFSVTNGTVTQFYPNYYVAEYRKYIGYDKSLRTGPYNFGFLDNPNLGNWVEHYPYQDGLLIWYLDYSFPDNNVGDYCLAGTCGGFYLPVDAHPGPMLRPDNSLVWRPRVQSFDSTFSVNRVDKICLNANSIKKCYGGYAGNSRFDDTKNYWYAPNPSIGNNGWASVPLPGVGVTITVVSEWNGWAYVLVMPK
ncbi:MAG: immune inhibitor A [Anaerolineales bacterium]|nr:immune inhibitor A [Anaerolineales bacterium]